MQTTELETVKAILAANPFGASRPLWVLRDFFDHMPRGLSMPDAPLRILRLVANGVSGLEIIPQDAKAGQLLIYLHGGAFLAGSPVSHRHLAAKIAVETRLTTWLMDYRLAPEAPFPAAIDDAVATYRHALDCGIEPANVVLAGDSAGAGLCLLLMLRLRDEGLPLPAAAALLSPWVDLTCSGDTYRTNAHLDPLISRQGMQLAASLFLADRVSPDSSAASPLYADLSGLPPLLIQVGGDETLLDDSRALASRATCSGVNVRLECSPMMVHVWHLFWPTLSEARDAIGVLSDFLSEKLAAATLGGADLDRAID
jgi:monoterpene epsilon-lactone hydrolase